MMLQLQQFLFESNPTRSELLDYCSALEHPKYRISVYRNHSFELIEHTIVPYLDYAEMSVEFIYSDYDDSLSFFDLDKSTDMIILWLDLSRYHLEDVHSFLCERLDYLSHIYTKPILVIPFAGNFSVQGDRIVCYDLTPLEQELGNRYLDKRMERFSGTKMSAAACMAVSKQLGLRYIPALLRPTLKAIVVDLDNTLYQGVLGEDGIAKLQLTEGHKKLQQQLKLLASEGIFLCVASKNDERDVTELFKQREDFPLRNSDFTKVCANWNDKAQSIKEIAHFLNIHPDSILFIDDNIGELSAVASVFPQIKLIHALEDAEITCEILRFFPGLLRLHAQKEDQLRKNDVQANEMRQRMRASLSPRDYIRSLEMKLLFCLNNFEQATRVAELANKTNQFICSYRRYGFADIIELMKSPDAVVITASLSDKLSDSGIVGVCVALKREQYVEIDECFVSCRALGRGIDEILVLGMIRCALEHFRCGYLKMDFVNGERNEPAKRFVQMYLEGYLQNPQLFNYQIPNGLIEIQIVKNAEMENANGR